MNRTLTHRRTPGAVRQMGAGIGAAVALAVLAVGVRWGLVTFTEWPITGIPAWDQIRDLPTTAATDTVIVGAFVVALWAAWAVFALCVVLAGQPDPEAAPAPETNQDSERDGPGVVVPVGVSAALAALTLHALARRRRARRRSIKPGTETPLRPRWDLDMEHALSERAGDALDRAWTAVRHLANPLRTLPDPPAVMGLLVDVEGDVLVWLSGPAAPVEPFLEHPDDPTLWWLPADTGDHHRAVDEVPVLETLVAVGSTDDGSEVFLDLESLGVVSIDGDPNSARALLRSFVAELALQPLSHCVDMIVTGDLRPPQTGAQGVVTVDRLDETLVRQIERTADDTAAFLADAERGLVESLPEPYQVGSEACLHVPGANGHVVVAVALKTGRLYLPAWLRCLTEPTRSAFVATGWSDSSCVLIAAPTVLDGLVDDLVAAAAGRAGTSAPITVPFQHRSLALPALSQYQAMTWLNGTRPRKSSHDSYSASATDESSLLASLGASDQGWPGNCGVGCGRGIKPCPAIGRRVVRGCPSI